MAKILFLQYPELIINSQDKIAITGNNGTGKSSLIRFIIENIQISNRNFLYIPQEISVEKSKGIIKEVKKLPHDQLGKIMAIIKKLGSEPARLLDTVLPSPGEVRKLYLALGISKAPELIIMDEPTNHLDLASIECIENALSECPCSLLLVSHDLCFLDKLTSIRWNLVEESFEHHVLIKSLW